MEENNKPTYRIKGFGMIALVAAAAFNDLVSLIPGVGTITGPIYWVLASWYLWHKGCGLVNARRASTQVLSMVAEMIPAVQAFPLTLAGILAVIVMIRIEDRTGIKARPGSSGIRQPSRPAPLNQNGVRKPLNAALILIALLSFTAVTNAQGVPATNDVDITVSTSNPVPGQNLTITARSFRLDINSSKVTWSINGKVAQSGTGLTTLTTIAPALGKKLSVVVTITTVDGDTYSNSVSIGSGSVDLIVETDGYAPPFFRGKVPISYQNNVSIIAMPHVANSAGVELDSKTLVYQWRKNNVPLENLSGYGKQSITLAGDLVPRPYEISVSVSTRDGSQQAYGGLTINANSPYLNFYVDDPLYGALYNTAVSGSVRIGSEREISILGVPYGFSASQSENGELTWNWLINNISNESLLKSKSIVLRAPAEASGSSNIQLNLSNNQNVLQSAKAAITAIFNIR